MTIIEKKVITKYGVEISFEEFWKALNELKEKAKSDWCFNFIGKDKEKERIIKNDLTFEFAKSLFTSFVDTLTNIAVEHIADKNGMIIENYGSYDSFLNVRTATFVRNGNHL